MSGIRAVTERLIIREATESDADFILELVNTDGWLRFIGDRNIHDSETARQFLLKGPIHFYKTHGYGSYCLTLKDSGIPIGMCGLYRRDTLNFDDLGYALLPQYEGKGYVSEACTFIVDEARKLNKSGLLAVTSQNNDRSIRVLERLNFRKAGFFRFDKEAEELFCFRLDLIEPPIEEPYMIRISDELQPAEKEIVRKLWNNEYPESLRLNADSDFDAYQEKLKQQRHFLLTTIDGKIQGWGCAFERDSERWFAMILAREIQGKGLGTFLLQRIKQEETRLYGWVIEATHSNRSDGTTYPIPLDFYLKNGFSAEPEVRLDIPAFSAHRIIYQRENN